MTPFVPACLISFPTHSKWSHSSAEYPAVDSEGGRGRATWLNTRTLQKDPVHVLKCHLSSPEQDRTWLQSIFHFLHKLTKNMHLWLAYLYSFVVCFFFGIDISPIFALSRLHSTLKPMRSSSVSNLTTTTSAPSSYWISPSWALTQSRWKPPWWTRMALSGRRDQRPQYLWNQLKILTHSSSAISYSRAELSLLHRGVHTLVSEHLFCCTQFWHV